MPMFQEFKNTDVIRVKDLQKLLFHRTISIILSITASHCVARPCPYSNLIFRSGLGLETK